MKKLIATLTAVAILALAQAPAHAAGGHKHGGKFAAGVAIGLAVVGIVAASRHASAHDGRYYSHREYREYRGENYCRSLRRECRHGDDRSCWKYEKRC